MSSYLPEPPLDGEDPYADFSAYLDRLIHLRLNDHHTTAPIALIVFVSYSIIISVIYFSWYWHVQRKEHRPLWIARLVRRPQGRYIALNQAVVTTITNTVISMLWLGWVAYVHVLWEPNTTLRGRYYVYFLNVSLIITFIPLFLITYLLISAGNLTSRRHNKNASTDSHVLPPWAVNSLLLVVFPALFLLMFVPSIISGAKYSRYINETVEVRDQVQGLVASQGTGGPLTEEERQAEVAEVLRLTYEVLNPIRAAVYDLQRKVRICTVLPFAALLLINLLGFAFILRHLRQDQTGQLVFNGTSVVAPLASHSATTTPSAHAAQSTSGGSGHGKDEEKGLGRKLSRSVTFTRNAGGGGEESAREDYETRAAELRIDDGTVSRAPWEITTAYFCVPLICILIVGFYSWVLSIFGVSQTFNSIPALEIAALAGPFAYTLVAATVTSALVLKKLIVALRGDEQPKPPRWQENPFGGRTNRRRGSAFGETVGAEAGADGEREVGLIEEEDEGEELSWSAEEAREKRLRNSQQNRRRSSLGVPSFRSSLTGNGNGRKLSIVSLASSVGSMLSGGSSVAAGGGGGSERRGSAEKEKDKEKQRVAFVMETPSVTDTRDVREGRGAPQSLMAGVQQVEEGRSNQCEEPLCCASRELCT
ncbi:hypothetical protein JCM11251_003580 [Rhodosporidiobolus azoricus]